MPTKARSKRTPQAKSAGLPVGKLVRAKRMLDAQPVPAHATRLFSRSPAVRLDALEEAILRLADLVREIRGTLPSGAGDEADAFLEAARIVGS